jgi:hypothetical protein
MGRLSNRLRSARDAGERGEFNLKLAGVAPLALIALWAMSVRSGYTLDEQSTLVSTISDMVTASAIVIGGLWTYKSFFRERLSQAKLNVDLELNTLKLPDGRCLVKVFARLENVGHVRIDLGLWRLRAEQILPLTPAMEELLAQRTVFAESDSRWHSIASAGKQGLTIAVGLEPGEIDRVVGNLVIPEAVEVFQVYSHIQKSMDADQPCWPSQAVIDLRQLEKSPKEGAKHVW